MNRYFSFLTLAVLLGSMQQASGAETKLAQQPLMNISGAHAVKPNLMLLYDNSGSMNFNYTPDYINSDNTCRGSTTMAQGTVACKIGHPPFASPDFNRQYYNPAVRYLPPLKADGTTYFNDMNSANTNKWKAVTRDGFGINKADFLGNTPRNTDTYNLVEEFNDLEWCDWDNKNCVRNTSGYTYPTAERYRSKNIYTNPYYYTIKVSEYCTNSSMTTCLPATAAGGSPDADYKVASKVRFCDSVDLTNCQAKFVDTFIYPRFGAETTGAWYGTITIGASADARSRSIAQVNAVSALGSTVIAGTVTAANGTDTAARRETMADALAAAINARTGDLNTYYACVRTPKTSSVPSCSSNSIGITLASNEVVAVMPMTCQTANATKNLSNCSVVKDNSRGNIELMVANGTSATALLTISGTANSGTEQVFQKLNFANAAMIPAGVNLGRGSSASTVAQKLADAIGTRGSVKAYRGGAANSSPLCQAQSTSVLCLVDTNLKNAGQAIDFATPTNNTYRQNNRDRAYLSISSDAAVTNAVPVTVIGIGASVFTRTDIVSNRNDYPRGIGRTDCAGTFCTYAEEMTNFANWYAYYRTRNQMMKTAVGQAFGPITDRFQVGLVALSVAAVEGTMNVPKPFTGTDRNNWYSRLYDMNTSGSTPVRRALHAIGKMYAKQAPYTDGEEAVKYACQQNFTFITTDGYWNGEAAKGVGDNADANVPSNDGSENAARFCLQSDGCVDPSTQTRASLADIALYWYNGGSATGTVSLRDDLERASPGVKVPAGTGENTRLHMRTYALGLGVDGIMNFDPLYDTDRRDPNGDFYKLINGITGCPWNNQGAYIWPDPKVTDTDGGAAHQSRVDDLWHAAINGHGRYFSASDPQQVIEGLRSALSNITAKVGAAAAATTSTANITANDRDIFSSTFMTVRWYGELSKRVVDPATGQPSDDATTGSTPWNSTTTLATKIKRGANGVDRRTIYMLQTGLSGNTLVDFKFSNMDADTKAWFANKCSVLTQCANMTPENRVTVNNGDNIVNWLRGWQDHADGEILRAFSTKATGTDQSAGTVPIVLGDIASAKPVYLREPRRNFDRPGYDAFKTANASRAATVFAAANDGMVHAFNAANGDELWAYAPRITMKKLHLLASTTYGDNHIFSVDGSPEIADVCVANCASTDASRPPTWKTVLVGGLNAGGRGYYALDVTDPARPQALWELCADAAACANVNANIGYSFGNPQFGTILDASGQEKWVVFLTSGYNNIPNADGVAGGDGKGHLLVVDVATGQVITNRSANTGNGSVTDPSGLAKISAITNDPSTDPRVTYVYGGDNTGKMWRFDFTAAAAPTVLLMGDAGNKQPITTRPEVTMCRVDATVDGRVVSSAQRVVLFGTGRLLDLTDVDNPDRQAAYLLKDDGVGITTAQWRRSPTMVARTLAFEPNVLNEDRTVDKRRARMTIDGDTFDLARDKGWFVDFSLNTGERVNLDPQVVAGTVNIVTNLPSNSTACDVGGTSNVYQLSICSGKAARADGFAGYPLAGSAAVGVIVIRLPNGEFKTVTNLADGTSVTAPFPLTETIEAHRAGWRRVFD